jgi:chromosome segregation ATPase
MAEENQVEQAAQVDEQPIIESSLAGDGSLADDIESIFLGTDEEPVVEEAEPAEQDGEDDGTAEIEAEDEPDELTTPEDNGGEELEEEEEPLAADGEPAPKSEKANKRITQLVAQKKEAQEKAAELEARIAEMETQAATTTEAHPDPDKEVAELRAQYATIKTPQMILQEEIVNPLTGDVYTAAEAQAAVAELKQDIQFRINEAQSATVERMNQARAAENLVVTKLTPHVDAMVAKYPQLDEDSDKFDQDMSDLFQATIDANVKKTNGLITGFKKDPAEFVAAFERVVKKNSTLQANQRTRTDKKIDKVPTRGPKQIRNGENKQSPEDDFMAEFDVAMSKFR